MSRAIRVKGFAVCACLPVALASGVLANQGNDPPIDVNNAEVIELTPRLINDDAADLDVRISISHVRLETNGTLLIPGTARNIVVVDATGSLPIGPGTNPAQLVAKRALDGPVTIRYSIPIGPRFDSSLPEAWHREAKSISGSLATILADGVVDRPHRISVRWNLKLMPPASQALSSYGEGDVDLPIGPISRLQRGYAMVGVLQRWTPRNSAAFTSVWGGQPPFPLPPVMEWTAQLHRDMAKFFREKREPAYRVFARYSRFSNAGGGGAFDHSFVFTYAPQVVAGRLKPLLAHEMVHTFTAPMSMGPWYVEGIAEYYSGLIPFRAGLISSQDFVDMLNRFAIAYYTSPDRHYADTLDYPDNWPSGPLVVIYARGPFYFAAIDAAVRRHTHGRMSVDDLIRRIASIDKSGNPPSKEDWTRLLEVYGGREALDVHANLTSGRLIVPPEGAFGRCLETTFKVYREYDLGFKPKKTADGRIVVTDLRQSSPASRAGIKEGEVGEIDGATQTFFYDPTKLLVWRGSTPGNQRQISFLPRGRWLRIPQWVVARRGSAACPAGTQSLAPPARR